MSEHSPPPGQSGRKVTRRGFLAFTAGALAAGCARTESAPPTPDSRPPPVEAAAPAPEPQAPAVLRGRTTIVIGAGREINGLSRIGRTDTEASHLVNAGLVTRNSETLEIIPWMAEELPSPAKGTWQVNPDGTMVTVWRVRPDIRWHDGTPFSTKDFVLGWEVLRDPKVPTSNPDLAPRLMERLETPDDRTLVIYWKSRYPEANRLFSNTLFPMPRHLMEEVYRAGNYEVFNTHPYWNRAAMHLGPFRVVEFVPGSHVDLAANEHYFLGRPKVDAIIWRIIPDSNAMLAAVLANQVDVTTQRALTVELGIVAEREWAAKGQGTVKFTPLNWQWLNLSATNPYFGWDAPHSARVRQAVLHAINRQEIVDTIYAGKDQVCHTPLSPGRRQFRAADAATRKYPYDPGRAQQLLAEAGWRKGPDGILVNERGERFSVEFRTTAGEKDRELVQQAIAQYLKAVGIETRIANLPDRQDTSKEHRNRWSGLYLGTHNITVEDWFDRFHSSRIPTEATEWTGENVSQWRNPTKDRLLEEMGDTLDEARFDQLVVEYLRLFTEELPQLPINYRSEVTTYRSQVRNVPVRVESGGQCYRTWNVHRWEVT